MRGMGSTFYQLCTRYSGAVIPTALTDVLEMCIKMLNAKKKTLIFLTNR